jgi:hypothetical protein
MNMSRGPVFNCGKRRRSAERLLNAHAMAHWVRASGRGGPLNMVVCRPITSTKCGGVVEWLMAPVLKTGRPKGLVGSNPTPSAGPVGDEKNAGALSIGGWSTGDSIAVRPAGRLSRKRLETAAPAAERRLITKDPSHVTLSSWRAYIPAIIFILTRRQICFQIARLTWI